MGAAANTPDSQRPVCARALTRWIAIVAVGAALLQALEASGATTGSNERPPRGDVVKPRPSPAPLGLRVAVLEPAQARAQGIAGGLKVAHATGLAYNSGLRVDDVIVEVDGRAVADELAFWDAMEAARWKPTLGVWRAGQRLSIRLTPPATAP